MPKVNKLTDIDITHISLVKEGANQKTFIYKSSTSDGGYEHTIQIRKSDAEKGVVYGIVYAPDEVDSQGDFADAAAIEKAAYGFMKARNTNNVDKDHSFQNEDAYVAESWIVKAGDPIFPQEPEGSWAVAIKLESEELKKAAKAGELSGLSMAGKAMRESVEKQEGPSAFKSLIGAIGDAISGFWIHMDTYVEKGEKEEMKNNYGEAIKKKIQEATSGISAQLEKEKQEQDEHIASLQKKHEEAILQIEELTKTNEALSANNKELFLKMEEQGKEIDQIKKVAAETQETLKKSKQRDTLQKEEQKKDEKGVM
jgi:hypothetical protein